MQSCRILRCKRSDFFSMALCSKVVALPHRSHEILRFLFVDGFLSFWLPFDYRLGWKTAISLKLLSSKQVAIKMTLIVWNCLKLFLWRWKFSMLARRGLMNLLYWNAQYLECPVSGMPSIWNFDTWNHRYTTYTRFGRDSRCDINGT